MRMRNDGMRMVVFAVVCMVGTSFGQWTRSAPRVNLTTASDSVGIGTTSSNFKLEVMKTSAGAEAIPFAVHNNSGNNGTAVSIGFEAVNSNTITGKIANVRVASNDYRTDFYNYTTTLQNAMSIYKGCLAIGTTTPGTTYKLVVEGKLGAREVVVTKAAWADYVFKDGYNLKPLDKVEEYVKTHKHLEGIPTQTEVNKNGVAVGEMQAKLLQKVEELTLYTIAMKKENDELKTKVEALEKKVGR